MAFLSSLMGPATLKKWERKKLMIYFQKWAKCKCGLRTCRVERGGVSIIWTIDWMFPLVCLPLGEVIYRCRGTREKSRRKLFIGFPSCLCSNLKVRYWTDRDKRTEFYRTKLKMNFHRINLALSEDPMD